LIVFESDTDIAPSAENFFYKHISCPAGRVPLRLSLVKSIPYKHDVSEMFLNELIFNSSVIAKASMRMGEFNEAAICSSLEAKLFALAASIDICF